MTGTHFFYPESLSNHPAVLRDELEPESVSAWLLSSEMLQELLLHQAEK